MSQSVNLPALGESVTEGTVTRWLKNVGDHVEVDEPLLEVSTDKVDTEIPSPVAGVIEEILVQEDETVEVGTALVTIGDGSAAAEEPAAPASETPAAEEAPAAAEAAPAAPEEPAAPTAEAPAAQPAPVEAPVPSTEAPVGAPAEQTPAAPAAVDAPPAAEAAPAQGEYLPSAPPAAVPTAEAPAAAPVAEEAPAAVPAAEAPAAQEAASAPAAPAAAPAAANSGYVTPLVRKLANEKGIDLSGVTGTGVGGRIRKQDLLEGATTAEQPEAAPAAAVAVEDSPLRGTTVPMSRLRKVVAERAVISMQSSAQLTSVVEVDVTKVAALRTRVKDSFLEKTGEKLSFLPFFALASAEALRQYPIINATIDGDNIVYPAQENMSIAVDTERGLLTPVVRDAGTLDIAGFAKQISDLASRTRDNKLKPDELAGGTFTLTNTGSRGALFDTPVVFLPQVAILGTGIVTKRPVVVSAGGTDAIAVRSMVYLALSYDHRIVDGADAARFLVSVKNRLEAGEFEADLGI
ncbi:2-oxoglutarate dehydrogenase E2 component [Homoserinimonas aerilata]|uniref:Dihydrolipoamide acetyltransferase component of pyruvate dehydrogenase complex n=1 Tax=Homoserinimonas aerilata TaxID=1162970 RepID=A0A542YIK7_9MICO|nr:2-oxoglutarate dehydrogenase, E2 component, dihydrolipoamide succinyltransferase [Homoserinimonas aerilata]TQL47908.1 2-oxoglutarate dehydrogenase E2 component [Homoserinimonas aerilata]